VHAAQESDDDYKKGRRRLAWKKEFPHRPRADTEPSDIAVRIDSMGTGHGCHWSTQQARPQGSVMQVPLSAALVIGLPVVQDMTVTGEFALGAGFVVLAGLAIGLASAADDAERDRERWHALTHRLPRLLP
jgi:hypothetical protein